MHSTVVAEPVCRNEIESVLAAKIYLIRPLWLKRHSLLFLMWLIFSKDVFNIFFTRGSITDKVSKCQCGISRTRIGTVFSNLMQHLEKKHPAELRAAHSKSSLGQQKCLGKLFYCLNVFSIHEGSSYVPHCVQPFAVVQDEDVQTHIWFGKVFLNTFKLYMFALVSFTEENITNCLLARFELVLDKHTTVEAHYVAVLATFPHQDVHG